MALFKIEQCLGRDWYKCSGSAESLKDRVKGCNVTIDSSEGDNAGIYLNFPGGSITYKLGAVELDPDSLHPRRMVVAVKPDAALCLKLARGRKEFTPHEANDLFAKHFRDGEEILGLKPRRISFREKLIGAALSLIRF